MADWALNYQVTTIIVQWTNPLLDCSDAELFIVSVKNGHGNLPIGST